MKFLIVLAATVALSAARPSYLGGIGAYPYLGGAFPYQGGAYPYLGGAYPYQGGAYPYLGGAYPYLGIPPASVSLAVASPLEAPKPVTDTPEVAQAKAEHLAAVAKAASEPAAPAEPIPAPEPLVAPELVQDTPEVAQARAEHLAAVEKAAAAAAAAPEVPIHSGLLYSGLHGLTVPGAFGYTSVAHAPIAPYGIPALGHGRVVTW